MSWKPAWRYQTIDFGEPIGNLTGMVQKTKILIPVSGTMVRLLFDNSQNKAAMRMDHVLLRTAGAETAVTLGGEEKITLRPGERVFSDPAELPVNSGETLCVEIRFCEAREITGMCQTWAARSWQTVFRNSNGSTVDCTEIFPWLAEDVHKPSVTCGFSQLDIFTKEDVRTIAVFGDSITHMSYYSDALLERLVREYIGKAVLANAGIGGNRLCHNASFSPNLGIHSAVFGQAGCARFEQDVFGTMQPDTVLMLEGINDVTHGFQYGRRDQVPTAEEFCKRYADVISCAHRHGARILIGTIMPENVFCGEEWFPLSEKLRNEINQWIRGQKLADGVIDFERLAADGAGALKEGFHMDGLHPNEAGGKEMASMVPLEEVLK